MSDFLSYALLAFCLELLPFLWCIWVFSARTRRTLHPSPKSRTTPLGVYGPRRDAW